MARILVVVAVVVGAVALAVLPALVGLGVGRATAEHLAAGGASVAAVAGGVKVAAVAWGLATRRWERHELRAAAMSVD